MDTQTGEIRMLDDELVRKMEEAQGRLRFLQEINSENLPKKKQKQLAATGRTKIGRNELCPCGQEIHGKRLKFKRCCLKKERKELVLDNND